MKDGYISSSSQLAKREAMETTLSLCVSLLEELDCARSLSVRILLRYEQWDQVAVGLPIDALWYENAEDFSKAYQATKLLTKADFLPTSFDTKKVALERFESAESQCFEANMRWRRWYVDGKGDIPPPPVDRIISMTKRNIQYILGRFPHEKLLDHCRWGPGATTSIRNPRTSVYEKYLEPVTGSGRCLTLFGPLVDQVPLWKSFQRGFYGVCDGNKVVFVPKDAKTLRSIAVEPSFDTFIQLGIGRLMRSCLLRHGVDLDSQQTNRDLARYGSLTGKVATIDLSMASDTAAKVVIEELFPTDWLVAMQASRSAHWRMGERSGTYSKFSSMGNGYTFEMETVLFYATASAVADYLQLPWWEVTAYGDDLTIGSEGVDLLTSVLSAMGFTVNASKSYSFGPFRESCGKDYFFGRNVRPYFVRSLLCDVRELIKFHNGIRKVLGLTGRTAAKALRLAHPGERIFGPASLGDTVFNSDAPRGWFRPASQKYPMFEGFIVRHWVFKPERERFKFLEPALLASLYSNKEAPTLGFSTLRKRGAWVTRTVLVPSWDSDGLGE
jgi:hypothetical protein